MKLKFHKYQATGNDFIVFDGRNQDVPTNGSFTSRICDRRFGIGADGVIIIKDHAEYDFEVLYFNPDGSQSLCGNGTRAAVRFAEKNRLFSGNSTIFMAYDGLHEAHLLPEGRIKLKMNDVHSVRYLEDGMFIDTGSPHLVCFVDKVDKENVLENGRKLRYETPIDGGTNVNFVELIGKNELKIRTYERGVEQETLSCGTGVTASAIAAAIKEVKSPVKLNARGGTLEVHYEGNEKSGFNNIYLIGPAEEVFEGFLP